MTHELDHWRGRKYAEVFEDVCARIQHRRETEPDFGIGDLEGLLQSAYVNAGNDWVGKGPVQETIESATIAAYEHLLAEWRGADEDARQG